MNGIQLIAAERTRQEADLGYSPDHDDTHQRGELAKAAEVLVNCAEGMARGHATCYLRTAYIEGWPHHPKWPFDAKSLKLSKAPIPNLVKAGALIAAEIDRLQRLQRNSKRKEHAEP